MMQLGPFDLKDAVIRSIRTPRSFAAELMAYDPPMQARVLGLVLVVTLSALLGALAEVAFRMSTDIATDEATSGPIPLALMQGALLVYGAGAMTLVGRIANGQGQFRDALLMLTWMEFVLILGQVIQLVLLLIFPLTAMISSALLLGLMFYLLVNFTAAVHGYRQLIPVAMGVIATFIGSAFVLVFVALALGLLPVAVAP